MTTPLRQGGFAGFDSPSSHRVSLKVRPDRDDSASSYEASSTPGYSTGGTAKADNHGGSVRFTLPGPFFFLTPCIASTTC